jgi:hypothetical protein
VGFLETYPSAAVRFARVKRRVSAQHRADDGAVEQVQLEGVQAPVLDGGAQQAVDRVKALATPLGYRGQAHTVASP